MGVFFKQSKKIITIWGWWFASFVIVMLGASAIGDGALIIALIIIIAYFVYVVNLTIKIVKYGKYME